MHIIETFEGNFSREDGKVFVPIAQAELVRRKRGEDHLLPPGYFSPQLSNRLRRVPVGQGLDLRGLDETDNHIGGPVIKVAVDRLTVDEYRAASGSAPAVIRRSIYARKQCTGIGLNNGLRI